MKIEVWMIDTRLSTLKNEVFEVDPRRLSQPAPEGLNDGIVNAFDGYGRRKFACIDVWGKEASGRAKVSRWCSE